MKQAMTDHLSRYWGQPSHRMQLKGMKQFEWNSTHRALDGWMHAICDDQNKDSQTKTTEDKVDADFFITQLLSI